MYVLHAVRVDMCAYMNGYLGHMPAILMFPIPLPHFPDPNPNPRLPTILLPLPPKRLMLTPGTYDASYDPSETEIHPSLPKHTWTFGLSTILFRCIQCSKLLNIHRGIGIGNSTIYIFFFISADVKRRKYNDITPTNIGKSGRSLCKHLSAFVVVAVV